MRSGDHGWFRTTSALAAALRERKMRAPVERKFRRAAFIAAGGIFTAATELTPSQLGAAGFVREWRFDYKSTPATSTAEVGIRLREASSYF